MALAYSQEQALKKDRFLKEEEKKVEIEGMNADQVHIDDILQRTSDGPRILDIGTGTAHIPLQILSKSEKNLEIVALDLSRPMVEVAKRNMASTRKTYIVRGDETNLSFQRSFL